MKFISTRKLKRFIKANTIYSQHRYNKSLNYDWSKIKCSRTQIVQHACSITNAQNYLEIGCFDDSTFSQINAKNKIGVDPESGGTHRLTSDQFFAENNEKFDVIFIDGLHEYNQVHKDIVNALKVINPNGFIIIDDMIPLNWREEFTPPLSHRWTGDVWKVGYEIIASKNMEFKILLADNGIGVIKHPTEHSQLKNLNAEIKNKRFKYFYEQISNLPLIEAQEGLNWMKINHSSN